MEILMAGPVLIKGAGDLATGVAVRLHRCGLPLVMTELPQPLMVRRTVAFGEAVYQGEVEVEGIRARYAEDLPAAHHMLGTGIIPVLVDPHLQALATWQPAVLIDAIMANGTREPGCVMLR
jgi:xanthine dehydrogenase accessory factor